ncbi:outer membrane protein OmpK, partial [Pseudomonas aeruginosa]|uniref:outer membrane protein OmpK n=1 Tax=Pseudomonas aeruginosa TaxID=287 RepID=UPI003CC61648
YNPPIQLTFTLELACGWTWGDLFFFFYMYKYNGKEDASYGKNTYYGEITPRLSLGKLTGADLSFGPVNDVLLAGSYEFGER